jgi:carboxyl-terminal processing protease
MKKNIVRLLLLFALNGGGRGELVSQVAGLMFCERVSFGKHKRRMSEQEICIQPQEPLYNGKVVILTGYATGSTSEVFAAGMQETGRAKIVGETTAGAILAGTMEKLPTGAYLMYAITDYRTPGGVLIEGRGVKPDVPVSLTRQTLLAERDLQIETAVKLIR